MVLGVEIGGTKLQVGVAEVLDRNAFEREPHPSRRRPLRLNPAITSGSQILNLQTRVRFPVALPTFLKFFIPKRIRVLSSSLDYRSDYFRNP